MSYDFCDSGVLKNRMHQDILQSTNSEIQYSDHSSHETLFKYRTNGLSLSRHNLVSSCTEQEENKKPPWDSKSFKEVTILEAEGDGEVVSFGIGLLLESVLNELYSTSMKSTCFERAQKICTTMNITEVCIHVCVVSTNAEKNAGEVSKNISSSDMLSHGILIWEQLNKELQDVVLDDAFRMEHDLEDSRLFRKMMIDWDCLLKHLEANTQKLCHAVKKRCPDFRGKLHEKDNIRCVSGMFVFGVLKVCDVRERTSLLDLYLLIKRIIGNTVPRDNSVTFRRVTLGKHTDLLESVLRKEGTLHLILCVFRDSDSLFKDMDYLPIDWDCLLKHLEANTQKLCPAVKKRCPDFRGKLHEKNDIRCASGLDYWFKHLKAELKDMCHAGEKRCPDFREKLHEKDNLRSASGSNECSENEQFMFFFALFALMLLVSTHSCCLKIDIDKPSKPSVNQSEQVKETLSLENGSEKTEILETERYGTENDSMRLSYSLDLLGGKRSRFIWICNIKGVKAIDETKQVQNGDKTIRARKRFEGELSANVIYKECFMKSNLNVRKHVKKFFDNGIGKIGMSARKLLDVFDLHGTSVEHGKDETELEELENNKGDIDAATPLEEVEDKRIEIGQRAEEIQESSSPNQDQLLNDFDSSVVSLSNSVREAQNDPHSFHSITGFDSALQNISNKLVEKVKGSNCKKSWRDNSNLQIPSTEIDVYHKDDCLQTVAEVEMSQKKEYSKFEPVLDIIKQIADGNDPGPQVTMRYELLRICTLRNYPKDNKPFLILFAKAGFYYAAEGDEVICYCCGLRRHSWVATDVPYRIHQRINPNCKFLNRNSEFNVPITYSGTTKNLDKLDKLLIRLEEENKPPQATTDAEGGNDLSEYVPPQALSGGLNNPKHRQYMSKTQRLSSYEGWPDNLIQTPEIMADAGFYYAGFGDCVRCYYCGIADMTKPWNTRP